VKASEVDSREWEIAGAMIVLALENENIVEKRVKRCNGQIIECRR
jgi:hypothetical protein